MGTRHENDTLDPNAPLLNLDRHNIHNLPDNEEDRHIERESNYSGTRFIWALTFSAGISGLLFGYEYGMTVFASPRMQMVPVLKSILTTAIVKHRGDILNARINRHGSLQPQSYNTRQKSDNVLHKLFCFGCQPPCGNSGRQVRSPKGYIRCRCAVRSRCFCAGHLQ